MCTYCGDITCGLPAWWGTVAAGMTVGLGGDCGEVGVVGTSFTGVAMGYSSGTAATLISGSAAVAGSESLVIVII